MEGNKKCFYKYINNKRRAKEKLNALLDMEGNIVTKDKEKAEGLNAFFVSLRERSVILRLPSPWTGRQGQGAE